MKRNTIILFGSPCSGKSTSLATLFKCKELVESGLRLIFLATDNNAIAGLEWGLKHYNIQLNPGQLIFAVAKPSTKKAFSAKKAAFMEFSKSSDKQAFQVGKETDANRSKYDYLLRIISTLEDFEGIDWVTQEKVKVGNISDLKSTDVLAVDGLSPITHSLWNFIQGDKLVNDQNDYQKVQKQVQDITSELLTSTSCHVIMLAHEEKDSDNKIRIALNCGQKLHGTYVGLWADSIYVFKTQVGKYFWSGKKLNVEDIATRNYPNSDMLLPDFSEYNFFK